MISQFIEDNYTHTTQAVLDELISELDRIEDVTSLVEKLDYIVDSMIDVSICKYDIQTSIYEFVETALLKQGIVIDTNTITYSYIRDILVTLRELRSWNDIHSPIAIDVMSDEELEDIDIFGQLVNIYTNTDPFCVNTYIKDILPGMIADMNIKVQNLEVTNIDDVIVSQDFIDCISSIPEDLITTNLYKWLLTKLTLDITYEELIGVIISANESYTVPEIIKELKVLLIVVTYNKCSSVTTNTLIKIESTLEDLLYSNNDIDFIIDKLR